MPARKYDILIEQGSNFTLTVFAKNSDGTVRDLTGYTARMQIRSSVDSATVLAEASTNNGLISIVGVDGEVTINIPSATTDNYAWHNGVYDLEVDNNVGAVIRLLSGNAACSFQVTR